MAQLHLTDEEQIGILQSFMAKAIVVVYLISKVNKLLNLGLIRGGGGVEVGSLLSREVTLFGSYQCIILVARRF